MFPERIANVLQDTDHAVTLGSAAAIGWAEALQSVRYRSFTTLVTGTSRIFQCTFFACRAVSYKEWTSQAVAPTSAETCVDREDLRFVR